MEEVGVEIEDLRPLCNSSKTSIWNNNADDIETHHLGMYSLVTIKPERLAQIDPSLRCEWIKKTTLSSGPMAEILFPILGLLQRFSKKTTGE